MKKNNVNELNQLIEVRQSIFQKLKGMMKEFFSGNGIINEKKKEFKTFEKELLTEEEQIARAEFLRKDAETAEFYKNAFENFEECFGLEDSEAEEEDTDYSTYTDLDNILENSKNEDKELSKEEFFELYSEVKSGKANLDGLSIMDLLKMETLLKEEIAIKTKDLENDENVIMSNKLAELEKENEELIKKLNQLNGN